MIECSFSAASHFLLVLYLFGMKYTSGCHMPTAIAHGSLQTSHNNAVITVTCKTGYKLIGSSLIYCDGKRWNSTIPPCRETDMMGSILQKKNSETETSFVVGNSLFKKEPIRVSLNPTQKGLGHSEIVLIAKNVAAPKKEKDLKNMSSCHGQEVLKVLEQHRQLQSPNTVLSFVDEKNVSKPSLGFKVVKITSAPENNEPYNPGTDDKSWHSWSPTTTQIQNSKITQKTNKMLEIKAILNLTATPASLGFMDPHFVKHEKNVATSSSSGSPLHLRTTTLNVPQTTTQKQSQYLSTLLENRTMANASANNSLTNVLAVALETTSKTIPPSTRPYNITQIKTNAAKPSKDTNIKIKANTTPAQMVTRITSSFSNYNWTLPVHVQTTQTPITEVEIGNVEDINSTYRDDFITGHNVTKLEYQATLSTNMSKPSNVMAYSTQKMPTSTAEIKSTAISRRNHGNVGTLKRAFKRKVQCVYPSVPVHGTFRFLSIRDPLPNQYPYYIQYSCYPGYTMSAGDVYSFCKDNGDWSGITPLCED